MFLTFRWFGADDPVALAHIRQIPGVRGIVSALYDVPIGEPWPRDSVEQLAARANDADLALSVIESIPVHEDIKLGGPTRRWRGSISRAAAASFRAGRTRTPRTSWPHSSTRIGASPTRPRSSASSSSSTGRRVGSPSALAR